MSSPLVLPAGFLFALLKRTTYPNPRGLFAALLPCPVRIAVEPVPIELNAAIVVVLSTPHAAMAQHLDTVDDVGANDRG
jgi:hypothetical protein